MNDLDLLTHVPGHDCWDYARKVFKVLTGSDIGSKPGYCERPPKFTKVQSPVSPCIVLMTSTRLHVGVYWNNSLWHLRPGGVPQRTVLAGVREHGSQEYYVLC